MQNDTIPIARVPTGTVMTEVLRNAIQQEFLRIGRPLSADEVRALIAVAGQH